MKKIVILFLIFVISANLFACTNKTNSEAKENVLSKEEMLAQAIDVKYRDVVQKSHENIVAAKEDYCGKIVKMTGPVGEVHEDHFTMQNYNGYTVAVYLPINELKSLKLEYQVTVVGKINGELCDNETLGFKYYKMTPAFLVQDFYELEGELICYTYQDEYPIKHPGMANWEFLGNSVYFKTDPDVNNIPLWRNYYGDYYYKSVCKISARMRYVDLVFKYYDDARIIEWGHEKKQ